LTKTLYICNGANTGKIYQLSPNQLSDDGTPINFLYTTWAFIDAAKAKDYPILGYERKLYTYLIIATDGQGTLTIRCIPNNLPSKAPYTVTNAYTVASPIVLSEIPSSDTERPINVAGSRMFVEFSTDTVGNYVNISKLIIAGNTHPWLKIKGPTGGVSGA
jgi:hypothetical protein